MANGDFVAVEFSVSCSLRRLREGVAKGAGEESEP